MAKRKEIPIPMTVKDSAINISGNVTVKVKNGNRVIKNLKINNAGTQRLFFGILQFIRGDYLTSSGGMSSYIPNYLSVGSQQPPTPTDITMGGLIEEIDTGERARAIPNGISLDLATNKVFLTLTALVPYSSVGDTWISELGLFSSKDIGTNTMLARVTLPKLSEIEQYGVKLEQGHSLFVQWTLNIQNV